MLDMERNDEAVPQHTDQSGRDSRRTHDCPVADLVARAKLGHNDAWTAIHERYGALVRSIARRYRLSGADTDDVSQAVWMKLFQNIGKLRSPEALPGWIATTASNECKREAVRLSRVTLVDTTENPAAFSRDESDDAIDSDVLRAEAQQAVQRGLAELTPRQRELLLLVVAEPPLSYAEISRRLGMPVGSIGPTRARCLEKLRATAALRVEGADLAA